MPLSLRRILIARVMDGFKQVALYAGKVVDDTVERETVGRGQ